jgi:hypothetical protein
LLDLQSQPILETQARFKLLEGFSKASPPETHTHMLIVPPQSYGGMDENTSIFRQSGGIVLH